MAIDRVRYDGRFVSRRDGNWFVFIGKLPCDTNEVDGIVRIVLSHKPLEKWKELFAPEVAPPFLEQSHERIERRLLLAGRSTPELPHLLEKTQQVSCRKLSNPPARKYLENIRPVESDFHADAPLVQHAR